MRKIMLFCAIALSVVLIASCTTFKLSGVQITKEMPSYQKVGEFEVQVPVMEFLGSAGGANLFNVTADKMDTLIYDAIQREIQKYTGDAAVNVTVEYKATGINILLNSLTGSILAPATAVISGIVVKYQ